MTVTVVVTLSPTRVTVIISPSPGTVTVVSSPGSITVVRAGQVATLSTVTVTVDGAPAGWL